MKAVGRRSDRSVLPLRALVPAVAMLTAGGSSLQGQSAPSSVSSLAFMSGCWVGSFGSDGSGTIEERYSPATEGVMLGTTRYLTEGRVVQFELTTVLADEEGVLLTPYPGGTRSEDPFRLTRVGENEAVFEAPEHDFPKRILYRRSGDRLTARIDGGEGSERVQTWQMTRTACAS